MEGPSRKRYPRAPVIEVVCEFAFEPSGPWGEATIDGLYESFKEEFPNRLGTDSSALDERSFARRASGKDATNWDFVRRDNTAALTVGPAVFRVDHFTPYPGWQAFSSTILRLLDKYLATAQPRNLEYIGLRYINLIYLAGYAEVEKYFRIYPCVTWDWQQALDTYFLGTRFAYERGRDELQLQVYFLERREEAPASALLDLAYSLVQVGQVDTRGVDRWLQEAHRHLSSAFEHSLTDAARRQFEEVE